ncbi:MAG: hypothetical protein ACRDBG_00980 [Waterburya sp.]
MSPQSSCPCCSTSMLLHLSNRRSYWFCSHCRLEMPNLNTNKQATKSTKKLHSTSLKEAIASHKSANQVAAI